MATPAYMSITGTKQGRITAGAFTEESVGHTYQERHA
ncbi:type VI secretion system tube protein Hcp, partial [Pseudomonas aeruginosa]